MIVVGAGPAGLASAFEARRRGLDVRILEADSVGASWRSHYDRLHLHTTRALSSLPGYPIPKRMGRWVARDDFIAYLEDYARRIDTPIEAGARVERIDRGPAGWRLTTMGGARDARNVVVASGYNHTPRLPDWPGRDGFHAELVHSSRYRDAGPYAGRKVLVVGAGNSGAEIAADLAEHGAARVWLSIRTPPNIVRRDGPAGLAPQHLGIVMRPLPARVVDPLSLAVQRVLVGDLSRFGIPAPTKGVMTRVREEQIPLIDVGFLAQLKAGRITVVGALDRFDGAFAVCGRERLQPDAVIAATGYSRGLEPLVGHLGVLAESGRPRCIAPATHPAAPGLYFIGFTNPISGNLLEIARDARALGKVLARAGDVPSSAATA